MGLQGVERVVAGYERLQVEAYERQGRGEEIGKRLDYQLKHFPHGFFEELEAAEAFSWPRSKSVLVFARPGQSL